MKRILVSACLMNLACRYDGNANAVNLEGLAACAELIPFCPEIYGGLPTPREPAEIVNEKVLTFNGNDVSQAFKKGAEAALFLCKLLKCEYALLKDKSPSCGSELIYDGTFTHTLTQGDGVTARLLRQNGIKVYAATQLNALLAALREEG